MIVSSRGRGCGRRKEGGGGGLPLGGTQFSFRALIPHFSEGP